MSDVNEHSAATDCYAPVVVTCWKTEDGKLFEHEASAVNHQQTLDMAKVANKVLEDGGSVADALRAANAIGEIDPVLERVTKDAKLVISHWQCSDKPGYQPHYFERGLSMYVGGDVGAWSGPYGSSVSLRDLVRYAKDDRTVFGA